MDGPGFSVSMCVYGKDHPAFFRAAVESVLNQTHKPDEIVIVVDGPVPSELDSIIVEYESSPVFRVFRLVENLGHGNARRASLEHCSYDLIALMDSDDISCADRFERQLAVFIERPETAVVGGNITEFISDLDNIVSVRIVPETDRDIKELMKTRCPMNQVTVMFRKQDVMAAGGYVDWYCEEDYYLWLRMMKHGATFANTGTVLVNVRIGEDMYRRRGGWKYYKSEARLQKYMLQNRVIDIGTYIMNCTKRFIVQVLLPNRLRGWVYKRYARKEYNGTEKV